MGTETAECNEKVVEQKPGEVDTIKPMRIIAPKIRNEEFRGESSEDLLEFEEMEEGPESEVKGDGRVICFVLG
ncbi:MAG: hypothetical protein ACTSVZ_08945 [Promethearchaeota archaeon]